VVLRAVIAVLAGAPRLTDLPLAARRELYRKQILHVWRLWRFRAVELSKLTPRWPEDGSDEKARRKRLGPYLCRPSGAHVEGKLYACRHEGICPFCWMRRLRRFWDRMFAAFEELQRRGPCVLILRRMARKDITDPVAWYRDQAKRRSREVAKIRRQFGADFAAMEWAELTGRSEKYWIGEFRQLWIVPASCPGLPLLSCRTLGCDERRYEAKRAILRDLVTEVGLYPDFLMKAPGHVAVAALKARQKLRTCSVMGVAYGIELPEMEPADAVIGHPGEIDQCPTTDPSTPATPTVRSASSPSTSATPTTRTPGGGT